MKKYPRIIFFGTPEFAVPSLKSLIKGGYSVVGVVTAPDRPAGRGLQMHAASVKRFAIASGIPVFQPENLPDPSFLANVSRLSPDLGIVIAFRRLPVEVWSMPRLGTFNLHASLLPQYRGAAPINRVIMNGETETGLTTFLLDSNLDTGRILFREPIAVGSDENAGMLHDRMMELGAGLVIRTVEALESGDCTPASQEEYLDGEAELKKAPKIGKAECRIDWNRPVASIYNKVRGLSPHPGAYTVLPVAGETLHHLKIYSSAPEYVKPAETPGQFITDGKTTLKVAAADGYLVLKEIQLEGKKVMNAEEFLRGNNRLFA